MRSGVSLFVALALSAGAAGFAERRAESAQASQSAAGSSGTAQSAAVGQQPGATTTQQGATTTLHVVARETVVDVTVTDAKGQPVHNLKQSDFTVKEDGKPQPIDSFHEYSERDLPPNPHAPPQLPPNVYTNLQPAPPTSAVNILLLDALNTLPADQVNMKQESMKYLKSMPKGTRIAVLSMSSSLRIMQGFTSDPAILAAVLDSKKNRALPSPFIDTDTGGVLDSQADDQSELANDDAAAAIQQFENELATEQQDIRNRITLEALNQIAAYVAGIKGRKNLIWFTDGMPLSMFPTGGVDDLEGITDYSKDLRKTTDLLTAAEVAVYPVDARKLFTDPSQGADQPTNSISVRSGQKQVAANIKYQTRKSAELLSMEAVAEATGGVAYYNTNDLKEAVGKAIANGANYYTVSYVPPDLNFDGRYHAIDVQVNKPGAHVAYRKGYNADDIPDNSITPALPLTTAAPEPYGNNMQASMGRGVPTSSQILFDVRMAPDTAAPNPADPAVAGTLDPKLKDKPLVRYEFLFLLPSREVTFSDGSGGVRKGSIEFDIAAYDVYGKRITGLSQILNLQLSTDKYQRFVRSPPQQFIQHLDLPPGETFVRVGILDGVSDKVGTLEIPLTVKKKPAGPTSSSGGNGGN
jgi:VWFA-related protein